MAEMRVLITGGAGRLGSRLVDALLSAGAMVCVLDIEAEPLEGAITEVIDVTCPAAHACVLRFLPDVVVHLAGNSDVTASVTDPEADAHSNILGALNMLHAAKLSGAKRFVFASSDAVRGDADASSAPRPRSPYGVSKLAGERYCGSYKAMYGLPFTALRLPEGGNLDQAVTHLLAAIEGVHEGVVDV